MHENSTRSEEESISHDKKGVRGVWDGESLKSAGGIAESEEHDGWFKQSERGDECSFPLIFLTNTDIVVTPANVEFHEVSGVLHVIDKFKDKR